MTYHLFNDEDKTPIKAWVNGVPFEPEAQRQLVNVASLPFIHKWIAAMPDVHFGKGATVGSVIPTYKAIIPAAVGVDIGCGMVALKTDLRTEHIDKHLPLLRACIEGAVPHGRSHNGGPNDCGAWDAIPEIVLLNWKTRVAQYDELVAKYPSIAHPGHVKQFGTLGTGNHFIEVCADETETIWVMLHSGSRGVGNRIGTEFIGIAKKEMEKWHIHLPDADLAYLPEGSEHFDWYVKAVNWAQSYAHANRFIMMRSMLYAMRSAISHFDPWKAHFATDTTAVNCHHNYVSKEKHFGKNVWLTRKGAVSAKKDELGIIPGSMGAKSYIVKGLGNPDSFNSCSHGAGRAMSRHEAKKRFTLEDHAEATKNVECRKDEGVLDETPGAYKSIDAVMEAQKDLVEIVHTLRQLICVKG